MFIFNVVLELLLCYLCLLRFWFSTVRDYSHEMVCMARQLGGMLATVAACLIHYFFFPTIIFNFSHCGFSLLLMCVGFGGKKDLPMPMKWWCICLLFCETWAMTEHQLVFACEVGLLCGSMKCTWNSSPLTKVLVVVFYCPSK